MSSAILRTGLWTIVAVLVTYVLRETVGSPAFQEVVGDDLLFLVLQVAFGLIVLGLIVRFIQSTKFRKNRCRTCGVKIPDKAIYCRNHLQEVLEEEDLRHRTLNTRLPD